MKLNNTVVTLALVGVLALAALAGGLLPAGNAVHAAAPVFVSGADTREVPENTPPGVNIGDPISATDSDETGADTPATEFGNTLTYKLGGTDEALLDIDASTGQLITKAPLNHEPGEPTTYLVMVTVDDGEPRGSAITETVTITVTDVDEPPPAPIPPTVVSGPDAKNTDLNESTTSLKVVWHSPENTGPPITGYEVQYKKATETSFSNSLHTGTVRIATIAALEPDTSYQVRVRATNEEAGTTMNWSLVGTGSTNKGNNKPPTFIDSGAIVTRDVDENEEAGQTVGRPVRATDDGVLPLTYRLEGPDADLFDFNPSSSQIRTKRGVTYNHEDPGCGYVDAASPTQCAYYVTVTAFDGEGGSDAKAVDIEIDDVPEAPGVPGRITVRATVRATVKSSRSLDVSWNEPENMGPPITGYDVRYRQGSSGTLTTVQATGTTVTIVPEDDAETANIDERLTPGASYEVYVMAKTGELDGEFSTRATIGRTSAGNRQPKFNDRPDQEKRRPELAVPDEDTRVVNRAVNENTRTGQPVGGVVSANDRDRLTYDLIADTVDADDVNKFDINKSTGQILTKDPLNHEDSTSTGCEYDASVTPTVCTYKVQVQVWDGLDEHGNKEDSPEVDDIIKVTIDVVDRHEPPLAPTVTVTSPEVAENAINAMLIVTWNAPENINTVPPLTSYKVECSGAGITANDPCLQPTNLTLIDPELSYTIDNLTPGSSYQVRVRAVNDESVGAWSTSVRQSTSKAGNLIPSIDSPPDDLQVMENTQAGKSILSNENPNNSRVGASNDDGDLRVTYGLEGPDAGRFTIDGNGQIKTKSSLNYEEKTSYTVRVKVSDNEGGSVFQTVEITVTNVEEPPVAPAAPRVTAKTGSGWSLEVTWNEPRNTGPSITDYDIRYRKVGDTGWQDWPHGTETDSSANSTATNATITERTSADDAEPLEPLTQYEVEVRAKNGEGDGDDSPADAENWSRPGRGTTGKSNKRPDFAISASLVTLRVDEDTRAGQEVGGAVEATDTDRNRLTYSLEGPGADSFTIVSSSGQIRTRAALNHEERSSYSVTVKVDDGQRRDNSVAVKSVAIIVGDVLERPSAPSAPRVTGIAGSTDSVRVTWDEPANTGPPIIDYDVRCLDCPGEVSHDGADRSTIITGLTPGTRYAVEVRANNGELTGEWSRSGTGSPNPDVANQKPVFSPSGARSFEIAENASAGDPIGSPVTAVDPDLDPVTHTLEGADATSFDIDPGSGQIRANTELNHEEKSRHSVTVKATDTRGGSATVGVTINVTDIAEPPDTPLAPTVTGVSSTSVQVSWDAPANTGPPITDYDYRYRDSSGSWTEVTNTTIRDTTETIQGLTPNTFYDVEVRATNAEGTSAWSNSGNGSTNAPGANNPPVFDEGSSATRSVSASAPPGTNIGDPVKATDADSGDTLTYSLEGRDAALFDIDPANGQLRTRTGVTLLVGTTYTLTLVADDGRDTARITVSIEATAAPPNNPPVFSEGASATRSVASSAAAGTAIGQPVRATDADAGTTLNYTLEGTDAASFAVNSASGQLLTRSGVTLDRSSYTVVVVASDGTASARITVTINVDLNTAPEFASASTSRSVVEQGSIGDNVGGPVTATDADQGDELTYILGGADAASFSIVAASGQIRTAVVLDEETRSSYTVTVTANDGATDSDPITVNISVTDVTYGCATGGAIADARNTGLMRDCEALLEARNKLENGARILNWSHVNPITSWQGVYFGGTTSRVTKVIVRRGGLAGTVAAELGDLDMLTELNLHSNRLSGEIPSDLANLYRLEKLLLHNNQLTGTIPDLSGLRSLKMLWLSGRDMNLTGGVPSWLNSMSSLESVSLWGNSLGGPIPVLTGMTSVNLLKLQSNGLTGAVPAWFADMSSLRILYLHDNNLTGTIPAAFGLHTGLVRFWLDRNNLTGSIPAALGRMTSLRTLNLRDNRLSGSIPPELGNLSNLQHLRLHNNQLSGSIPAALGDMSSLRQLWVSNNQLSGSIPAALGNLSSLQQLNLHTNQLSGDIPSALGRLSNLTRLRIGGVDGNRGNIGLFGCVPAALRNATDADDLALAGANGISICP